MATDVEDVVLPLSPELQQSSEWDAICALLKWPLTTTATWNTKIGKISILFKSLLLWKIHLIVYLRQEKTVSFYCYCIQPKNLNFKINTSIVKIPAIRHVIQEEILIETSYLLLYEINHLNTQLLYLLSSGQYCNFISIMEYYSLFLRK